jgi:hypothetical protein
MSIVNPVLKNAAAAGMISGIQSSRLQLVDAAGELVEPADFSGLVTAAGLFAVEVDAVLQTVSSPPANIALLISASGVTAVPANAAAANAAESLPAAMTGICKAAFEGRSWPLLDANGVAFTSADYTNIANACVALFVEFAANTTNT